VGKLKKFYFTEFFFKKPYREKIGQRMEKTWRKDGERLFGLLA
jgi:hypothetical protein